MKRLLVFIVVAIVTVSFGFTVYAFVKNNEQITLLEANHYINCGETFEINFDVVNKKRQTDYTYKLPQTGGLDVTSQKNVFKGVAGGEYTIEVSTTNKKYESFTVTIVVGDGSKEYPFFIKNKSDFLSLGTEKFPLSSNYKLVNDIDLTGENFVGFSDFTGNFYGNNCKILNAKYDASTALTSKSSIALFNSVSENSVIENVTLQNFEFTGEFTNVAVVTLTNNGTLRNLNIQDCKITNSATNGKSAAVAVINQTTGNVQARIDRVASNTEINAQNLMGGICVYNKGSLVLNSFTKGNLNALSSSANIAGLITYNQAENNNLCYVKDCYSVAKISVNAIGRASLIYSNTNAYSESNVLMGCYYVEELTLCNVGVFGIESENYNYGAITKDDLKDLNKLVSYVYSSQSVLWSDVVWSIDGEGYPSINFLAPNVADYFATTTSSNEISDINTLIAVFSSESTSSDRYILTQDIDCSSIAEFVPLGITESGTVTFSGTLEAGYNQQEERYYTIKNININSAYANAGFIAVTGASAQLINIRLENVKISTGVNIGALVGTNNGLIDNCEIVASENAVLGGENTVTENLGGVAGVNNGTIINSVSSIKLTPYTYASNINVGGITGNNTNFIYNSVSDGEIACSGADSIYIGGISGTTTSNIHSCVFNGTITADMNGTNYIGGISAYSSDSAKFTRCRNLGILEGKYVGGIVSFSQKSEIKECTIEGILTGDKVGGVSYRTPEIVMNDVSVLCYINGKDEKSVKAGIAVELVDNSKSYCGPIFMAVIFDDNGSNYVTSYHCTNTAWPWEWNHPNGIAVRYAVFDKETMSNAKRWVLTESLLQNVAFNDDGGRTMSICMNLEPSTIFANKGFSSSTWQFAEYEYPVLINCANLAE